MKKALLIFGGLALVAGGSWAIWRFVIKPNKKLSFPVIDWEKRIVQYDGPVQSGTTSFEELLDPTKNINEQFGDILFNMYAGSNALIFSVYKGKDQRGNPLLKERKAVDFTKREVVDFSPVTPPEKGEQQ